MTLRSLIPTLLLTLCCVACTTTDKPPYEDTARTDTEDTDTEGTEDTEDTEDTGEDCTDLDCENNGYATFYLGEHYSAWQDEQDAEYTFTVTWDSGSASCTTVVSGSETCDSAIISLQSSGNGGGGGGDSWNAIDAILLTEFTGDTVLTIERDGAVVREQSFVVEAVVWYPNDEECPPECVTWGGDVDDW